MTTPAIPLVLRPDIYASAAEKLESFIERGYTPVEQYRDFRTGQALNARSHRYPEARERGIGVALAIFEKPDSFWERKWGIPDVEFIILRWDTRLSVLGLHHVEKCRGLLLA
jgi:hypothetical protein